MAATARLVVQMAPREKRSLDDRAKKAGLPTAEFVRRRLNSDDLDEHRDEIEALLTGLESQAPAILAAIDQAIATARSIESSIEEMRSGAGE